MPWIGMRVEGKKPITQLLVAFQAVWENPSYHGDYHWSLCGPSLSQLFTHASLQLQVRKQWVEVMSYGEGVSYAQIQSLFHYLLTAWEGKLEDKCQTILTWLSIWGRLSFFSSYLEDWVQQAPVGAQIPYRSTWTQRVFNLACLWNVTVNSAIELYVLRHASPDISIGETSEFNSCLSMRHLSSLNCVWGHWDWDQWYCLTMVLWTPKPVALATGKYLCVEVEEEHTLFSSVLPSRGDPFIIFLSTAPKYSQPPCSVSPSVFYYFFVLRSISSQKASLFLLL